MNLRWAIAGGAAGVLAGVVLFAPASWLAAAVAESSAGHVQLVQVRGTVWNGHGRLVLGGGADSRDAAVLPGQLAWRLRPRADGAAVQLFADCCTPQALQLRWRARPGGAVVSLADATSQWPAGVLTGLGAPFNTLQLRGRLRLRSEGLSLEWSRQRVSVFGKATLDVLDVSSRLSTLSPIGSYRLALTGAGPAGPAVLQLQTLEGELVLSGTGRSDGGRWRFRGEASASAEHEPVLGNLLNIVGRRNGARSVITLD